MGKTARFQILFLDILSKLVTCQECISPDSEKYVRSSTEKDNRGPKIDLDNLALNL